MEEPLASAAITVVLMPRSLASTQNSTVMSDAAPVGPAASFASAFHFVVPSAGFVSPFPVCFEAPFVLVCRAASLLRFDAEVAA